MYSPSGRIAAPTHRMSWQGGDGTKSENRDEDEEMAARRWGDEMRDNDKSTNMQKRGATQKGGGVGSKPYRIYLCICSDLAPKSQSEKKDQRIKQKTQSTNSFCWPSRIAGDVGPRKVAQNSKGFGFGSRPMTMHHQCRGTLISNLHLKLMHARQDQPAEMPMQWLPRIHWKKFQYFVKYYLSINLFFKALFEHTNTFIEASKFQFACIVCLTTP